MTDLIIGISELEQLEKLLEQQASDKDKEIKYLQLLINHYTFTNIDKAQLLLERLFSLITQLEKPEVFTFYYAYKGFIENQLYNYEEAEDIYLKALEIIEEYGDIRQKADAYIDLAGIYINLHQLDNADEYLRLAEKLLDAFPDELLQARITCREGFLQLHYGKYREAIEWLLKADKQISTSSKKRSLKDYYFITLIYSGLGNIYEINADLEKSAAAYLKVLNVCHSTGLKTRLSWHYLNVGKGYIALNDTLKASEYFEMAISLSDNNSHDARAAAYANLGYCYFLNQSYDEALDLYDRASDLYEEKSQDNNNNFSVIESWKAELFAAKDMLKEAEDHFTKAFEYAKNEGDFRQMSNICKSIAEFYAQNGDYENAYEYQLLHSDIGERYNEEVNSRRVLELEIKYEAEKKKQEAEMLRLQTQSLQQKALRAQMNPHFMYNALNSIQNFITSEEVNSAAKYLAKFAKLMRQSLDYSDLETISLEKEIDFLEDYLYINQKLRFRDFLQYRIFIDEEIEEDILGVPTMIVQPYVENAIEHGLRNVENGLVKLEFHLEDEDTILCIIEDNGIGREKARQLKEMDETYLKHRPKGTSITEERLEILHNSKNGVFVKTIDLKDEQNKPCGTRVEVLIPVVDVQMK